MSTGSHTIDALTRAFVKAESAGDSLVLLAIESVLQHRETLIRCIDLLQHGANREALTEHRHEATDLMILQAALDRLPSGTVLPSVSDIITSTVQRYRETIGAPGLPDDVMPFDKTVLGRIR